MSDQPSDPRFEAFLREAASDYHAPPPTPREEIWAGIAARRAGRRAPPLSFGRRRWTRWGLAAAAILALGVAVGRLSVRPAPGGGGDLARPPGDPARRSTYLVAAGQHLNRVEALLTAFRVEARAGGSDRAIAASARELLASHRMLLDSPAAAGDRRLKQLLDDLELVLAQIAQVADERDVDAAGLILQALDHSGVLLRLRTAPAARSAVNTQGVL